VNLADDLDHSD